MQLKRLACLTLTAMAMAQDTNDPITDRLRYEIAAAQRDFLIAKQQYEQASTQLKAKMDQAEKACAMQDKVFSPESFSCTARK